MLKNDIEKSLNSVRNRSLIPKTLLRGKGYNDLCTQHPWIYIKKLYKSGDKYDRVLACLLNALVHNDLPVFCISKRSMMELLEVEDKRRIKLKSSQLSGTFYKGFIERITAANIIETLKYPSKVKRTIGLYRVSSTYLRSFMLDIEITEDILIKRYKEWTTVKR